ncbi:hypothetical protein ACFYYS_07125 [Streptomyces sp. NPDC002120]|uniref:hypothetical protein n=1 Tax=Streptomyces sp. NPDC002120 TaxID=3364631 RepID=UPI0036B1D692
MDGWLLRGGAHSPVTRHEGTITLGRVGTDPSRVLAGRATWSDPAAAGSDTYCSPLPGGALAISSRKAVTVHEADGSVRWEHRHDTWPHSPEASGARTPDPTGRVLLTTMAGPLGPDGAYAGDICRALYLATGEVLAEHVLPSFSAQYPDARPEVLLTASMGQDGTHCLLVTSTADELDIRAPGTAEEPYVDLDTDEVLCRTQDGVDDTTEASHVLPDEWVFVGSPSTHTHSSPSPNSTTPKLREPRPSHSATAHGSPTTRRQSSAGRPPDPGPPSASPPPQPLLHLSRFDRFPP